MSVFPPVSGGLVFSLVRRREAAACFMACRDPMTKYRCSDGSTVWNESDGDVVSSFDIGCGQCVLCRQARASQLSCRLVNEAYCHERNICATLTYSPECLPRFGSVSKRDCQLWLKRLRFVLSARDELIRFFLVAEYSPVLMRPHYHVLIYGYWPDDAVFYNQSRAGSRQFRSVELEESWGKGLVTFQDFSAGAAGYCARHQSFKLLEQEDRLRRALRDADGSVIGWRDAEFTLSSRRPGIGAAFFDCYGKQMLALGYTVVDGQKLAVPSYYLRRAESLGVEPAFLDQLKADRELAARIAAPDATRERLRVREVCARARLSRLSRGALDAA